MTIDPQELDAFVGAFVGDLAAVAHAATVVVGDKLGLYRALAEHGPATAAELAADTGCDERFLARVAERPGGQRLLRATTRRRAGSTSPRSRRPACADERTRPSSPARSTVAWSMYKDEEGCASAFRTGARRRAGTSTTTTCSTAPSASSAPATSPTS